MIWKEGKKFKAKKEKVFYGKTKEECKQNLIKDRWYMKSTQNPRETKWDKGIIDDIYGNFATLILDYHYTEEQFKEVIDNIQDETDEIVRQERAETQADMDYDRMKDEQFEKSMEKDKK